MSALASKLGLTGSDHLFLRFENRACIGDGTPMNTFGPTGPSGGALIDLGAFPSADACMHDPTQSALLCGMVVEYHRDYYALVPNRIGPVINGIRIALADQSIDLRG